MDVMKSYSRRSFVLIFVLGLALSAAAVLALYFGMESIITQIGLLANPEKTSMALSNHIALMGNNYFLYMAAAIVGIFIVFGMLLWISLRGIAGKALKKASVPGTKKQTPASKPSAAELEEQKHHQQRLFLHLLSVLQREGRLVDFFSENLDLYEDEQIGAAVRGIHTDCKKIMDKSLMLKPVIDQSEGEQIEVEAGFDPGAIKLTGNVTGNPPFNGILRHRGWRIEKLELPSLSGVQDPGVIAPAEVEIV